MAVNPLVNVADEIAVRLAGASFVPAVVAARRYRPIYRAEDLAVPRVTVVPKEVEIERESRGAVRYTCSVDIAVQGRVDPSADNAAIDALMDLVHSVECAVRDMTFTRGAQLVRLANAPAVVPEHIDQYGVVTSVLTATVQVVK